MREADFNTEVVNSIKDLGGWAFKVPDIPASMVAGLKYTPEKPCDIIAGYKGKFLGIEGKQLKEFKAFGIGAVRPNQIKALNEMVETGNRAFLFLNIRIKAVKGKTKHDNRLIPLDWAVWRELLEKTSLKKDDLVGLSYIQGKSTKTKGSLFDLTDLLKSL